MSRFDGFQPLLIVACILVVLAIALIKRKSGKLVSVYHSKQCNQEVVDSTIIALQEARYSPSMLWKLDFHGYLQTMHQFSIRMAARMIFKRFLKSFHTKFRREEVVTKDGGTVSLDWASTADVREGSLSESAPVVIISHGMAGNSRSEYIVHFSRKLMSKGYRVAAFVARGCGGLKITAGSIFAGRKTSDIRECIELVRRRYPHARIFYVGYSLGAALALQYAADYKDNTELTAIMSVTPPWNMAANVLSPNASQFWGSLLSFPIRLFLLKHYYYLRKVDPASAEGFSKKEILFAKDTMELDKACSRIYGSSYGSMDNYYKNRDVRPAEDAHKITTPTLVLTAIDDPICSHADCPISPEKLGPGLVVLKTLYGGHVAYPEGICDPTGSWVDRLALVWFEKFLKSA